MVTIVLILAGIAISVARQHRERAIALRRADVAAALNAAEQALSEYNSVTAPGLGKPAAVVTATEPASRISQLKSNGFIVSQIVADDVQLSVGNGAFQWTVAVEP